MEVADVVDAELDRLDDILFHRVEGGIEFLLGRLEIVDSDVCLVEIAGETHQRGIALRLYRLDDRLHLLDEARKIGLRALQQVGPAFGGKGCVLVEGNI